MHVEYRVLGPSEVLLDGVAVRVPADEILTSARGVTDENLAAASRPHPWRRGRTS